MPIKLKDIQPPMMEVELPDGTVNRYDPFAVISTVAPAIESDPSYAKVIEVARKAFDLPDSISDYHIIYLVRELVKFVEESGAVKGLMPVPQN